MPFGRIAATCGRSVGPEGPPTTANANRSCGRDFSPERSTFGSPEAVTASAGTPPAAPPPTPLRAHCA
ncbi:MULTISPECIES: DUF6053 domain-containing protein [Bacteria]|uniref:DUF6053 domain-containing protein n=1 Tax=Bacteria TaxID=2 RepID=UPI0038180346